MKKLSKGAQSRPTFLRADWQEMGKRHRQTGMVPPRDHEAPRRWWDRCFEPVDIASLVFFRIAFGVVLLGEIWQFFVHDWINELYIAPRFHFTFWGFEWARPWPGWGMYVHFFILAVLAGMVLVGLRYRLAAFLFSAAFTYLFLMERAFYLNHFYLVCLVSLLMTLVPANGAASVDAWLNPALRRSWAPSWSLWLLRLQIAIPYFYGGLAKFNGDWLAGQPMQTWMGRMENVRAVAPIFGELWLAILFSWGGLLLDLFVVPLLLWKRTRAMAFILAVAFHVMNSLMFRIGMFPWFMICATTLFLSPDWPRKLLRLPSAHSPADVRRWPLSRCEKALAAALAVLFAWELMLPFRHFLYPGDVDWTEEGSRFSWRMMLCDKVAATLFLSVDPQTREVAAVDIAPYLTSRQLTKMSYDPEMAREFAAFLKDEARRRGEDREIHVILLCSLNGRSPQLLIDPAVDLGAQTRSLSPKDWILPLSEPLPRETYSLPPSAWMHDPQVAALYQDALVRVRRGF